VIEFIPVRGRLTINVGGRTYSVPNTVTSDGKAFIAQMLSSAQPNPIIAMAVGTGSPGASALGTEVARKNLWYLTAASNVITYKVHWDLFTPFSGTLTEAGLFNSASLGGTMLASAVLSPSIVKATNDNLDITWDITIG